MIQLVEGPNSLPQLQLKITDMYIIAERISARLWIEDLFSQSMYVRTWWVMRLGY